MTKRIPTHVAASVRQRLHNFAKEKQEDFNFVLGRFVAERLLFRWSVSEHGSDFVLNGAMLLLLWSDHPYRPTRDVDLLGYGESSIGALEAVFRKVCRIQVVEDDLIFGATPVRGASIREDQENEGVRIVLTARLGNARVPVQIDIGFGDAITPGVEAVEFPLLLTTPALPVPKLNAYPRETVIAEKLEAMVSQGMANSRMKDFYDLFTLAENFPFDGTVLVHAVQNTFARRATPLPDTAPVALTAEFSKDTAKTSQWKNFTKRAGVPAVELDLALMIE